MFSVKAIVAVVTSLPLLLVLVVVHSSHDRAAESPLRTRSSLEPHSLIPVAEDVALAPSVSPDSAFFEPESTSSAEPDFLTEVETPSAEPELDFFQNPSETPSFDPDFFGADSVATPSVDPEFDSLSSEPEFLAESSEPPSSEPEFLTEVSEPPSTGPEFLDDIFAEATETPSDDPIWI